MIRVIAIDEHQLILVGMSAILTQESDIELVGVATTPDTGVELVRKLGPDVVMMEVNLPQLAGIKAVETIITGPPVVKVLILTASDSQSLLVKAIEAGASGYLPKTASASEIIKAIRSVAAGELIMAGEITELLMASVKTNHENQVHLTPRELEVLRLVAKGFTNREVAAELFIENATVKTHLEHIFSKLNVSGRARAVIKAHDIGLLDLEQTIS